VGGIGLRLDHRPTGSAAVEEAEESFIIITRKKRAPQKGDQMDFHLMIERAMEIRQLFSQYETQTFGRPWTREEVALGFVGDVGDLVKLVMAANGVRNIPDVNEKLAHELSDCLWSVMVLAKLHDIDIEQAFNSTMNNLERHSKEILLRNS
jgi:NTP pyrophosphatase (non-canonical NTP hydrolase)